MKTYTVPPCRENDGVVGDDDNDNTDSIVGDDNDDDVDKTTAKKSCATFSCSSCTTAKFWQIP